jgi:RNA polymerase-binding protein DksA
MKALSEAELLAAPLEDYMSARQREFFRNRLLAEEQALLEAARETTQHLQETEAAPDWTDRASSEEEHSLELRIRDRERKLLKKIRETLERIDDGSATAGVRNPQSPSASPACSPVRPQRFAWMPRSAGNNANASSATESSHDPIRNRPPHSGHPAHRLSRRRQNDPAKSPAQPAGNGQRGGADQ